MDVKDILTDPLKGQDTDNETFRPYGANPCYQRARVENMRAVFARRFREDVAAQTATCLVQRQQGLKCLATAAVLLTEPTGEAIQTFLSPLRDASQFIGADETAFDQFFVLICQNRSLTDPEKVAAALGLASKQRSTIKIARTVGLAIVGMFLAGPIGAAGAAAANVALNRREIERAIPTIRWSELLRSLALIDIISQIGIPESHVAIEAIRRFCGAPAHSVAATAQMAERTIHALARACSEANDDGEETEISFYSCLINVITEAKQDRNNLSLSHDLHSYLSEHWSKIEFLSISCLGEYIRHLDDNQKRNTLLALLDGPVEQAFDVSDFPKDKRDQFRAMLVDRLLSHEMPVQGEWVARIGRQPAPNSGPPLPAVAPVAWKDREADDTPATFLRRVYGPWIGRISKQDIRKIDGTFITNLNIWLRSGNELPEDLPLLKVKDENDKLLAKLETGEIRLADHLGRFTGEEAAREAGRLYAVANLRKKSIS